MLVQGDHAFSFSKVPLLISSGKWSVLHSPPKFTSVIKGSESLGGSFTMLNAGYQHPIDPAPTEDILGNIALH